MVDILGKIVDLIPSAIKERLISKEERKQKHLADIKKEVLEPMLKIFDEIYIPVLKEKEAIIECTSQYIVGRGGNAIQYSGKAEWKLEITSLESRKRRIFSVDESLKINQNLYEDIKKNHYKEFIKSYEKFKSEFESYGNEWLSYAIQIQKIIESEMGMSLFYAEIDITKESFVDSKALAVYIIERITGVNPYPLTISESPWISLTIQARNGYPIGLKGTREQVQKCLELVNRLIGSDKKYDELHPVQEALLKSANHLRNELDKLIKTYEPLGRCNYV